MLRMTSEEPRLPNIDPISYENSPIIGPSNIETSNSGFNAVNNQDNSMIDNLNEEILTQPKIEDIGKCQKEIIYENMIIVQNNKILTNINNLNIDQNNELKVPLDEYLSNLIGDVNNNCKNAEKNIKTDIVKNIQYLSENNNKLDNICELNNLKQNNLIDNCVQNIIIPKNKLIPINDIQREEIINSDINFDNLNLHFESKFTNPVEPIELNHKLNYLQDENLINITLQIDESQYAEVKKSGIIDSEMEEIKLIADSDLTKETEIANNEESITETSRSTEDLFNNYTFETKNKLLDLNIYQPCNNNEFIDTRKFQQENIYENINIVKDSNSKIITKFDNLNIDKNIEWNVPSDDLLFNISNEIWDNKCKNTGNKIVIDNLSKLNITEMCEDNILKQNNVIDNSDPNINVPKIEINIIENNMNPDIDFDCLHFENKLIHYKKPKKPYHRNNCEQVGNHLKKSPDFVKLHYDEVKKTGIADLELERIKLNTAKGNIEMIDNVKIGLSIKLDFTKLELKQRIIESDMEGKFALFKKKMLLQIKGRRMCQCRLVAPIVENINSGECYILVTPNIVYLFIGKFANIIEINKANEICNKIVSRKELGVNSFCKLITINEKKISASVDINDCSDKNLKKFWTNLSGSNGIVAPKEPEQCGEEESYEQKLIKSTKIYKPIASAIDNLSNEEIDNYGNIDDLEFKRASELEGKSLKYEILGKNKIFIFDFGSEVYVWSGCIVPSSVKEKACKFAKKLYQDGLDFSLGNCRPIYLQKDFTRPDWTLLSRIVQNGETILFREKFSNWPEDIAKKLQNFDKNLKKSEEYFDMQKLISDNRESPIFMIEEHNIGRGHQWYVMEDGIKWQYIAITKMLNIWSISDSVKTKIAANLHGTFFAKDCYIIKWDYNVNRIVQTLGSNTKENQLVGRDRCVYFYWQGSKASLYDQGTNAVLTKYMDGDGVQIPILQDKEPSCFLSLFTGKMVVYKGKRKLSLNKIKKRLYLLKHIAKEDAYLVEVPVSYSSLRSTTSFVLENSNDCIYIWHGKYSLENVRKSVIELGSSLIIRVGNIPNIKVFEQSESDELFLKCLNDYNVNSFPIPLIKFTKKLRIFQFIDKATSIEAIELLNSISDNDYEYDNFPFIQSDLYKVDQHALFLVDASSELYLWDGQYISDNADILNEPRYLAYKKRALDISYKYACETTQKSPPSAYYVKAREEPIEFKHLFPSWKNDTDVDEKIGKKTMITDILFLRKKYSLEQLQQKKDLIDVDPLHLEDYLSETDFNNHFKMSREEFMKIPKWRKEDIKKKLQIF